MNKIKESAELPSRLVKNCPTRWSCEYDMFKRVIELKEPIKIIMNESQDIFENKNLSEEEFIVLSLLIDYLSFFDELTQQMEGGKYSTLCYQTVFYSSIIQYTSESIPVDKIPHEYLEIFKGANKLITEKIYKYYKNASLLTISCMLMDPRYKTESHILHMNRQDINKIVTL